MIRQTDILEKQKPRVRFGTGLESIYFHTIIIIRFSGFLVPKKFRIRNGLAGKGWVFCAGGHKTNVFFFLPVWSGCKI
ncbi:MAG TPA: hypothetical protein DDW50_18400 [Firmicutes bacterium]|nr:hypothetical protein [Bacillota bacterium]